MIGTPLSLIAMIALENISACIDNQQLFANLNNSFENGQIHGIWHEKSEVCTHLLKLLAGYFPPDSGWIRYGGVRLDHTGVAYYNRTNMPDASYKMKPLVFQHDNKLLYLFDDIFDMSDTRSFIFYYKILLSLKKMGKTILVTSPDYRTLIASTDLFHILSNGAFQATIHFRQYDLLEDALRQIPQS